MVSQDTDGFWSSPICIWSCVLSLMTPYLIQSDITEPCGWLCPCLECIRVIVADDLLDKYWITLVYVGRNVVYLERNVKQVVHLTSCSFLCFKIVMVSYDNNFKTYWIDYLSTHFNPFLYKVSTFQPRTSYIDAPARVTADEQSFADFFFPPLFGETDEKVSERMRARSREPKTGKKTWRGLPC
jgi:hypothetical protein